METPENEVNQNQPEVIPEQAEAPKPKKSKKPPKNGKPGVEYREIPVEDIVLAKDDSDPRWDPRLDLPLDKDFTRSIAERDIEVPPEVTLIDGKYHVNDGRQRVRAIPEANKLRKTMGLPPIKTVICAIRERDDVESMLAGIRLNEYRLDSDAITRARSMMRLLDVGQTEGEIAKQFRLTPQAVQAHLSLLSLPKNVQDLVVRGKLSVSAAAGVAKLDPAEVNKKANALIAAATEGKVTGRVAARATGQSSEPDRLPAKKIKVLIEELKKADLAGKHGDAVKHAAIYALEVVLDARKLDGIWDKLDKTAKEK